LIEIYSLFFI